MSQPQKKKVWSLRPAAAKKSEEREAREREVDAKLAFASCVLADAVGEQAQLRERARKSVSA